TTRTPRWCSWAATRPGASSPPTPSGGWPRGRWAGRAPDDAAHHPVHRLAARAAVPGAVAARGAAPAAGPHRRGQRGRPGHGPAHARAWQLRRVRAAGAGDAGAAGTVRAAGSAAVDVRPGAAGRACAARDRPGRFGGLFLRPLRRRDAHFPSPPGDGAGRPCTVRRPVPRLTTRPALSPDGVLAAAAVPELPPESGSPAGTARWRPGSPRAAAGSPDRP